MTPTNPELRQFIVQFFSDEELETLAFDYFPEAANDFGGGMSKSRKVIALIGHCERRDRLADLHAAVARERAEAWGRQFTAPPVETFRRNVSTTTPQRDPRQIFLSHATADAEFAHQLAGDLRAEGWRVWIAPESIRPGEKWVEAIDRGLETSGVFVVVLTPAAVASRWVNTETDAAVEMQHEGLITFIPLDVIACQPKRLWRQYQYVLFRGSYMAGLDGLLRELDKQHPFLGSFPEGADPLPSPLPEGEGAIPPTPLLPSTPAPPKERRVKEEQWRQLQALAHEIAAELGRQSGDDELREVYRRFNHHFGLGGYRQLPRRRFAEGLAFLTAWRDEVVATSIPDNATEVANYELHEKTDIELIRIPAGPFLYSEGEQQQTIELPEYWIGRYPLTNAQYKRFVDATGHDAPKHWNGANPPPDKLDHPVVNVDWHDAQTFCDWAELALPTEEEWEKAARGSDGRIWPWGNDPPTAEHCNFNMNVGDTTPVGRYSPRGDSPYGCADMAGNVWEWTATGDEARRVLRGGSWNYNLTFARAVYRFNSHPYDRNLNVGCRLVRRPPSQAL